MLSKATVIAVMLALAACTTAKTTTTETLTFWTQWTGPEFAALGKVLAKFEASHPGIKVTAVEDQADAAKFLAAVKTNTAPDAWVTYRTDQLGVFCTSGALINLGPRIDKAKIDAAIFPPAAKRVLGFEGTRCSLPFAADAFGLYYNKKLLSDAGYSAPPKTIEELTAYAKKLTTYNADGSIKTLGFMPLMNVYENYIERFAPCFAAHYFDESGKANFSRDPGWAEFFTWQRSLVEQFGFDKLTQFAAKSGDQYSAANPFEKGKIALALDGEWRTQYIKKEQPGLEYGTAPFPVPAAASNLYGVGEVAASIIGIPKGTKHPAQAWELVKYLATNTDALVDFMNEIHNVPTTLPALHSPRLDLGPNFEPFLQTFANPGSYALPILKSGSGSYIDPLTKFMEQWQAGKIKNLQAALVEVDKQVDALVAQG
jgi:multiple sugar transport system substrate-binding protein